MNEDFLDRKLNERREQNNLRQLRLPAEGLIDFCSNDYLGIIKKNLLQSGDRYKMPQQYGSGGSRLLTGNYPLIEEAEAFIASFHEAPAALIFNSGYDANTGLLSCVPQKGDTVLYDYLSHASIRDGVRLSFAESFSFRHNDLDDLEDKLGKAKGNVFVVTESVFSMDGDQCPLTNMVSLCEKYNARLIIDEAHATGVIGDRGEGLVQQLDFQERVFARVHTFGKACGIHGAAVLGSVRLRDYLINFSRPFIYSTSLPPQTISHIMRSYQLFPVMRAEREQLRVLVKQMQGANLSDYIRKSETPVQGVLLPGNESVKKIAAILLDKGIDARPILYPTVPKEGERIRIVLHAFNSVSEVDLLLNTLKNCL